MLIANGFRNSSGPLRYFGGASLAVINRANWNTNGSQRNLSANDDRATMQFASVPDGYPPPASWLIPEKAGRISSRGIIRGSGNFSGSITAGRNLTAAMSGIGAIASATAGLIVSATAGLTGTGSASSAGLRAIRQAVAGLTGSGGATVTATAKGRAIAGVSGQGSISATIRATGAMSSDIVVIGDLLTTANVADAVWKRFAEGTITYDQMLRIVASATAGKVSGGPNSPVFRNLSDTQNQITGTADSNGNRTSVTYGD